MLLVAILFGIIQILCCVSFCVFLRWFFNAKQAEVESRLETAFREWVEQPEPGKPSKLAETTAAVGAVIGQAAAQSIMASLNAERSHLARVANGAADELQGQQNPLVALLAGGRRGKGAAVLRLAEMLGGMVGRNHNGSSTDGESVRERFNR